MCEYVYKGILGIVKCPENPLPHSNQGLCVYHEQKRTEDDLNLFIKGITRKIEDGNYNYIGYVFPTDMDFAGITFKSEACFNESIFLGKADFFRSIFAGVVWFSGVIFCGEVKFNWSSFQQLASFSRAIFKDESNFCGVSFSKNVLFNESKFKNIVYFGETKFNRKVSFNKAEFNEGSVFDGSFFGGSIECFHTKIKKVDFGEFLFRQAKRIAGKEGNHVDEGYYHIREMDAVRKQQPRIKQFWNYIFQRLLHGYGEKPLNVALFALLIIILSTILFVVLGIEEQSSLKVTHSFLSCLYYSIVTFTTLGYGDLHPAGLTRVIASVEALFGVFLMALFVVTFARRWRR